MITSNAQTVPTQSAGPAKPNKGLQRGRLAAVSRCPHLQKVSQYNLAYDNLQAPLARVRHMRSRQKNARPHLARPHPCRPPLPGGHDWRSCLKDRHTNLHNPQWPRRNAVANSARCAIMGNFSNVADCSDLAARKPRRMAVGYDPRSMRCETVPSRRRSAVSRWRSERAGASEHGTQKGHDNWS